MTRRISLTFLILLVVASCSSTQLIHYSDTDINQLIKEYNNYYNPVNLFEARANISFNYYREGELETESIRAKIYWTRNDSLFLDLTYSVLGFEAAKIFIGKNYYIYRNREGQFIRGFVSDDYLQDIFNIDFPLKDWGRILFISDLQLGNNPEIERNQQTLELIYPNYRVRFRNDYPLPAEIIYFNSSGETYMKLSFYGAIDVDGIIFPEKIVYYNQIMKFESITEYSSIEINQAFDESFQLRVPYSMEQLNGKN
ncbi:MAG: hypothetical protein KDD94_02895 [Calditrichaeota bacterium]|nr:hypothetical protein [Calditrichota bacterium]